MRQYTTPTLELRIAGVVLDADDKVWVSLEQGPDDTPNHAWTKHLDIEIAPEDVDVDGTDTVVNMTLTQNQSAGFAPGRVNVQVNWVTAGGKRSATDIKRMDVGRNLMEQVVSYE